MFILPLLRISTVIQKIMTRHMITRLTLTQNSIHLRYEIFNILVNIDWLNKNCNEYIVPIQSLFCKLIYRQMDGTICIVVKEERADIQMETATAV